MPVAMIDSTSGTAQTYFIHTGQIDEPLVMTDASQTKVWDAYVEPFGQAQVFGAPSAGLDLRLPGQFTEAETGGLHQNWNRNYDPSLGRYIEADPLGLGAGQNVYAYAGADPLSFVDRLGLAQGDWWDLRTYLPDYDRAHQIAREELKLHHGHNNNDDARRHAEWSCRMQKEIGPFTAWSSGTGHELDNLLHGGPWSESMMDLHNNAEGRDAASQHRSINPNNLRTRPSQSGGPY
jgi:RHS repeat-associated protein